MWSDVGLLDKALLREILARFLSSLGHRYTLAKFSRVSSLLVRSWTKRREATLWPNFSEFSYTAGTPWLSFLKSLGLQVK